MHCATSEHYSVSSCLCLIKCKAKIHVCIFPIYFSLCFELLHWLCVKMNR